jgi:hypothetical protein
MFMDELEALFEGKELKPVPDAAAKESSDAPEKDLQQEDNDNAEPQEEEDEEEKVITKPRGDWTEVADVENDNGVIDDTVVAEPGKPFVDGDKKNSSSVPPTLNHNGGVTVHGESQKDNYHDDVDGEPIEGENHEDVDGEDIDGKGIDGEDIDGQPIEDKINGQFEHDVDGEAIDDDELDGEDLDGEAMDEEALDGDELDGEEI